MYKVILEYTFESECAKDLLNAYCMNYEFENEDVILVDDAGLKVLLDNNIECKVFGKEYYEEETKIT